MQISQNPAGDCIPVAAVNERSENTASRTRRVETRPRTTRQLRRPPQHYTHGGGEKRTILVGTYLKHNHYTYVLRTYRQFQMCACECVSVCVRENLDTVTCHAVC